MIPFDDQRGRTNGDGQPLSPDDFTLTNFDLSRDGRKLAFLGWLPGAGRRQLWEIMVESGERKLRLSDDLTRGFVRYSRSGEALAFDVGGAPKTLRMLRASAVEERIVAHADLMYPFDWTPDETAHNWKRGRQHPTTMVRGCVAHSRCSARRKKRHSHAARPHSLAVGRTVFTRWQMALLQCTRHNRELNHWRGHSQRTCRPSVVPGHRWAGLGRQTEVVT